MLLLEAITKSRIFNVRCGVILVWVLVNARFLRFVFMASWLDKNIVPRSLGLASVHTEDSYLLGLTGETYLIRYEVVRQFLVEPEHDGKARSILSRS